MLLASWKEIAGYLRCGMRTVQRWEKRGLPVHRPVPGKRSHVVAYSEELDWWITDHEPHRVPPKNVVLTIEQSKRLCQDSRIIRTEVRARLRTLREGIASLRSRRRKAG